MDKELRILYEDNNEIYLSWDKVENAKAVIMGKNTKFDDARITTCTDNKLLIKKETIRGYLELYVEYVYDGEKSEKEIILGRTNVVPISTGILKFIKVKMIKSYKGISILFESKELYNRYLLYEIKEGKNELVLETDDFILTTDKLKKGKKYYVEAYKLKEEYYCYEAKTPAFEIEEMEVDKMDHVGITVMIPVYNCESYLPRCIDSILLSSFKDYEFVFVNDGSKDNSSKVLDWYKKTYGDRVHIYNKENGGPASARNEGMKHANGEYIAFIDSDDMVHPYMLEELYNSAKKEDADIAIGKVICKNEEYKQEVWLDIQREDKNIKYITQTYEEMMENKYSQDNIYIVTLWNQIIRTSLVQAHPIPDLKYYEDAAYTRLIYSYIDKFVFALNAYYVWDRRIANTTGTISSNYNKNEDPYVLAEYYSGAIFYWLLDHNKKNLNYLIYDSLKECMRFITLDDKVTKEELLKNQYAQKVAYIMKTYDLNKNKLVIKDDDLSQFLKLIGKILKKD